MKQVDNEKKDSWQIGSIAKALKLLNLFSEQNPTWTLAQISQMLSQPKSSVLNMLRTLESCDILIKDDQSQSYRLGLACMELGYNARSTVPILPYAIPILEDLQADTGKIVYLTIPRKGRVLYLESFFPGKRNIHYSISGKTLPMHCTGCGKAMLAHLPKEEVLRILEEHGLPKYTENTFTDIDLLLEELERIRQRGYALDLGEESVGVKCVAVPILNRGQLLGSVSVSGSNIGMLDEDLPMYAEKIMGVTNLLSFKADLFPSVSSDI